MRALIITLFVCLATLGVKAQEAQTVKTDSIIFNKLEHDYGTIEQGANGNCEFTFTNKGKEPLVLSNVKASCGCTVPQWTREPIEPGKTGVINVRYNTSLVGNFNKSITVTSNAANSTVLLRIKGNVKQKEQPQP